jgi:hypothetical protein
VKETAERLMDLAEAHIRSGGYGGFSFRDLAAEIGIKSAKRLSPFSDQGHDGCRRRATLCAAIFCGGGAAAE